MEFVTKFGPPIERGNCAALAISILHPWLANPGLRKGTNHGKLDGVFGVRSNTAEFGLFKKGPIFQFTFGQKHFLYARHYMQRESGRLRLFLKIKKNHVVMCVRMRNVHLEHIYYIDAIKINVLPIFFQ